MRKNTFLNFLDKAGLTDSQKKELTDVLDKDENFLDDIPSIPSALFPTIENMPNYIEPNDTENNIANQLGVDPESIARISYYASTVANSLDVSPLKNIVDASEFDTREECDAIIADTLKNYNFNSPSTSVTVEEGSSVYKAAPIEKTETTVDFGTDESVPESNRKTFGEFITGIGIKAQNLIDDAKEIYSDVSTNVRAFIDDPIGYSKDKINKLGDELESYIQNVNTNGSYGNLKNCDRIYEYANGISVGENIGLKIDEFGIASTEYNFDIQKGGETIATIKTDNPYAHSYMGNILNEEGLNKALTNDDIKEIAKNVEKYTKDMVAYNENYILRLDEKSKELKVFDVSDNSTIYTFEYKNAVEKNDFINSFRHIELTGELEQDRDAISAVLPENGQAARVYWTAPERYSPETGIGYKGGNLATEIKQYENGMADLVVFRPFDDNKKTICTVHCENYEQAAKIDYALVCYSDANVVTQNMKDGEISRAVNDFAINMAYGVMPDNYWSLPNDKNEFEKSWDAHKEITSLEDAFDFGKTKYFALLNESDKYTNLELLHDYRVEYEGLYDGRAKDNNQSETVWKQFFGINTNDEINFNIEADNLADRGEIQFNIIPGIEKVEEAEVEKNHSAHDIDDEITFD